MFFFEATLHGALRRNGGDAWFSNTSALFQALCEPQEGLFEILSLGAPLSCDHHNSSGAMRQSNRRLGLVAMLSTGATCGEPLYLTVVDKTQACGLPFFLPLPGGESSVASGNALARAV